MESLSKDSLYQKLTGNMKFLGIFNMIYGVLASLTIIGAVVGVPLFIAGTRLRDASENLMLYKENKSEETLERAFALQNSYFFINKILIIISFVVFIIYIIAIIMLMASGIVNQFPAV